MSLSSDLLSQFVKEIKPAKPKNRQTTVYGTAYVDESGSTRVLLDGSDTPTPAITTAEIQNGERVTVLLKSHRAIITGNIDSPAARNKEVDGLSDDLVSFKSLTVQNFQATNARIEELDVKIFKSKYANIEELIAESATIADLQAKKASVEDFTALEAYVDALQANKLDADTAAITYATITDLNAAKGDIGTLRSDVANINTLMFGSATGTAIQTSFSNSVIAQLGDAQIKSAMIDSVAASKITAGDIITNNVRVKSQNGLLLIADETIQINDANRTRVQIGKDAANDYSINVWDESGNLMFSKGGITDSAIKEAIIRNDMVSDTANIAAHKLDIDSLFDEINGSSKTIKSSRVYLDEEKQTLDISFKTLTSDVSGLSSTVSSQGTAITTIQGQISSKIWQQDIDTAKGEMSTQYTLLSQDLTGFKATVGNTYAAKSDLVNENLLSGSKDLSQVVSNSSPTKEELSNGFTAFKCTQNWHGFSYKANDALRNHVENDEFTFSFNAKTSGETRISFYALCFDSAGQRILQDTYESCTGGQFNNRNIVVTPTEEQDVRLSQTFKVTQGWIDTVKNGGNVWWTIQVHQGVSTENVAYLYAPKLERGNRATAWSPSTSDIDTRVLSHESSLSVLQDAISSTVGTTSDSWSKYTQMVQKYDSFTWTIDQTAIIATEIQYAIGDSSTTAPTSGWANSVTWTSGKYTWMKTRYKYANGEYSSWTSPVCITGNPGTNGKDATRLPDISLHSQYTTTTYYEIAKSTLGSSVNSNYGYLRVWGTIGAYESEGNGHVDLNVGFRNAPTCILTQRDSSVNTNKCNIVGYLDSSGYTHVYLVLNGYALANLFVEGLQYTIVDTSSTTAPSGTKIFDLATMTAQNAQTATNYMHFSTSGLVVGDMTADVLGNNVLIDSDSVDIRNGTTTLASFGADYLYLARNSRNATIDLCNGLAKMYHQSRLSYDTLFVIETPNATEIRGTADPLCVTSTVASKPAIKFANSDGVLGSIGMVASASGAMITRNVPSTAATYTILDTGNFYTMMDSGWINCTLGDGFSRYSNNIPQPQVRKIGKQVYFRGEAKPSTAITPGTDTPMTLATIPSGYRPGYRKQFVMQGSGSYRWLLIINTDGTATISRYSNSTTTNMEVAAGAWLCCHAQWTID